jgi:peptide/nickel transport system substrate-binding protein
MIWKKGRRVAGVGTVCALALVASACGGGGSGGNGGSGGSGTNDTANAVKGGTLNMLGSSDVDYFDPNLSYYTVGALALRPWSRTLFTNPAKAGATTTTVPDMASEMPSTSNGGISKDGMTWTIHLRDGLQWNTKPVRPVVAGDVVRGIKRMCNPQQPMGGLPDFLTLFVGYENFCKGFAHVPQKANAIASYMDSHDIPGVVAKDDKTLVFKLTSPAAYLPSMMTMTSFSAAPVEYNKYLPGSTALGQHTIADGPYQVQSWNPTKSITYVRNPAWKASSDPVRKAYVDKIVVNETVTQESAQQQLETGSPNADLEFGISPQPSRVPQLQATKDPNLVIGDTSSSNPYIIFNYASPNNKGALSKLKVRQALEYAINRDNIVQVLGGKVLNNPLTRVIPKSLPAGESGSFDLYKYDPAKAKKLLAQAGYPNGLTLKFLYRPSSEGSNKTYQTVKQDLTKAGITIKGVTSPDADFYTKYLQVPSVAKRGVWDLSLAGWGADWYGTGSELSYFKPLFSGKPSFPPVGSNFGLYDSSKTNSLIDQAVAAKTADQSQSLFQKVDMQVMKDAAFFPITNPKEAHYHASQVHNAIYIAAIQGFDPTNVWLDKNKQGG